MKLTTNIKNSIVKLKFGIFLFNLTKHILIGENIRKKNKRKQSFSNQVDTVRVKVKDCEFVRSLPSIVCPVCSPVKPNYPPQSINDRRLITYMIYICRSTI